MTLNFMLVSDKMILLQQDYANANEIKVSIATYVVIWFIVAKKDTINNSIESKRLTRVS